MADPEKTEFSLPAVTPTGPAPAAAFVPGTKVLVTSADGRQYPAVVRQVGLLVAFENGQEQWVSVEYIAPGA